MIFMGVNGPRSTFLKPKNFEPTDVAPFCCSESTTRASLWEFKPAAILGAQQATGSPLEHCPAVHVPGLVTSLPHSFCVLANLYAGEATMASKRGKF